MDAPLSKGKANSGIEIVECNGSSYVRRFYGSWLSQYMTAENFRRHVAAAAATGLVVREDGWAWQEQGCHIAITNPYLQLIPRNSCEVSKELEYRLYEELLENAKALYFNHGLFVSDAHSDNLVICKINGEYKILIVDGKVAGLTDDISFAKFRLNIKLRCEKVECHKWFLWEYIKFLKEN